MTIKARIERLENHRADQTHVTLTEIVEASYWDKDDPRFPEFNERCARSPIAQKLAETFDRGRQADSLVGGSSGETK